MSPRRSFVVLALALAALCPLPGRASEVKFFRMQSLASFLPGTFEGVSVDALGTLRLADRVERLAGIEEPFLLSAAVHPEGWVLGTGNGGKVLLLDREGSLRTLWEAPEPEIFAVWADPDGTVYAGSSPDGKVYRVAAGTGEEWFDPGETYIWALERAGDGGLLVATGTEGRLYRVQSDGRGEVLFDGDDTHVRAVKALPGGGLLIGTAGEGLILRLEPDGSVRTLHDASEPEVVAFAVAPDGTCYAAVLASESSLLDLGRKPAERERAEEGEEEGEGEPVAEVTVVLGGEEAPTVDGTRPRGFRGPRSEVLRISPAGVVESVWSFAQETVYALLWHRERLWVGTGLEGKIFSFVGGAMVLEKDVDERQVVALLPDRPGPAFATTNAAAFYRATERSEQRGLYTSPALDAGQVARFGNLAWRGEQPRGTAVRLSFRSGVSAEPDRTWSSWTGWEDGEEIGLGRVPPGKYLQWRAELRAADGRSPAVSGVTVSYRQENLSPRIKTLSALDPGQILVPANFNPANQVYEPAHPNREGIFTTLEPSQPREEQRLKTLWKRGFRTLSWEAEDPNGDPLTFALAFRPEEADGGWLPVAEDLDATHYSFDATVLPDGLYRFRLTAADRAPSSLEPALTAEELSEPVVVDHTPPALGRHTREGGRLRVAVEDALSPLREAVYSVDAGEWKPAVPADGLLDGRQETLILEAPEGARLVLLKITDAAFNAATFDLGRR